MRKPLVAGNWKMHGSRSFTASYLEALKVLLAEVSVDVALFPPSLYLMASAAQLDRTLFALGAQDLSREPAEGAFTGEVCGTMLRDVGCQLVLVGHSERRSLFGESNELVAQKFAAALSAGLTPVLCVGETLGEREAGNTIAVVHAQLQAVADKVGLGCVAAAVVAYEPVWAIGTGKTATPEQAQAVHAFIRGYIAGSDAGVADKVQILYGGSMNAANAASLLAQADIDGGLIGGASLKAEDFLAICTAAN